MIKKSDFIVIGSGLAGLTSSLILAKYGKVLLVTKSKLSDGSTNWAQGGIACVVSESDNWKKHYKDTLIAGAYHNDKKAVEFLVKNAPKAIEWLGKLGVPFEKVNGKYKTGREGGHSYNRIIHATDFTGKEIERVLTGKVLKNKNIKVWKNTFAKKLLVKDKSCFGLQIINRGKPINFYSKLIVLATGGLGQVYQWTTNPQVCTGDGFALAYEAGAKLADLEFVQFHPTALKHGKSPLFLLSEALRGEGAYLVKIRNPRLPKPGTGGQAKSEIRKTQKGERFMDDYDKRLELAPRDIVARAIIREQQKEFEVYLDIRHKGKKFIKARFPNIYKNLEKRGFDLSNDLIPVTCAAHFSCGGVATNLYGRTSIKNLFAFGEVACTGIHGANRLASNSLLEAVVFPLNLLSLPARERLFSETFGDRYSCFRNLFPSSLSESLSPKQSKYANLSLRQTFNAPQKALPSPVLLEIRKNLQRLIWKKVGIVRRGKELKDAKRQIEKWGKELVGYDGNNVEILELKNMITTAKLITQAALNRRKSLGAHFIV